MCDLYIRSGLRTPGRFGRRRIDDGALIVVAKDDHKLRIEVGYTLEGRLTDVTTRRIIDEDIVPKFRPRHGGALR